MQPTNAIWIDVDNSPHVPLFVPIVRRCEAMGRKVVLTARHYAQTVELLQNAGLNSKFEVIGEHSGKSKVKKLLGLFERAWQLRTHIQALRKAGVHIAVALSHGSRSMVLAARQLGIPVITMYDYEYTETFIFNTFSDYVMVPSRIPDATLDKIGLKPEKRIKYDGYKEELYLHYYEPDTAFWQKLEAENGVRIQPEKIIVTLRPPASAANYHNRDSEALLEALLKRLLTHPDVFTIVLPRTKAQQTEIEGYVHRLGLRAAAMLIPKRAVNGLDLAYHSDLLISGGGTMNREAALLGVPVYSIFSGKQGALDADMERRGLIRFIRSVEEIDDIEFKKKNPAASPYRLSNAVEEAILQQLSRW